MTNAVDPVQAAIQAAIAKAAAQSDHGKAVKGGGGADVKAGLTILTLVAYVEVGIQKHEIKNKPSYESNDVTLVFEMNGGANKAAVVDGKIFPNRVSVTEKLSQNEKANYLKLFNMMNYDGQATHGSQLVGKHYLSEVYINDNGYATLKGVNGYDIKAPIVIKGDPLDPENQQKIPVPAPVRGDDTNRVFLWDYACQEMWDQIYIDGEYEAKEAQPAKDGKPAQPAMPAKSKNAFQIKIKSALNWTGSPMQKILGEEALNLSESPLGGTESGASDELTSVVAEIDESIASEAQADPLADLGL